MADDRLQAVGIAVQFGGVTALADLDFELRPGEILGLIGPNGAGKTTLVNVLTGFQRPSAGRVLLRGQDITGRPAYAFTRAGIARTFQNVRLFKDMTVLDNLEAAGVAHGMSRRQAREKSMGLLEWTHLHAKAQRQASSVSYGEERMVGIARALMTGASFLLLDEPAAGMNDAECDELVHLIAGLPDRFACGVMLIDHNMRVIMGVCRRIHVIGNGRTLAQGTPGEIRANRAVIEAYLGRKAVSV